MTKNLKNIAVGYQFMSSLVHVGLFLVLWSVWSAIDSRLTGFVFKYP